ncbi:AAA family ATPase [Cohnella sp. REN36]|uniref:AAA family ATPase n=1 Tax=Cohnella sp. REN36 TaxID=2887347 RepID=UPI001D13E162|nr:AAA family ATPase [Cohnella sp. REN36]
MHGEFQMLGSLKISLAGEDVTSTIRGGKARLLLAYLVLPYDMPRSRKQLAFDFWPDSSEKQALSNLRKLLHDIREAFPPIDRYFSITSASIQWNPEVPVYSDVAEFERMAQGQTLDELRRADQLYRGELLPGFYEEWVGMKRELLDQTMMNVLERLIARWESRREYASALLAANKLLIRNPLREETYRTIMRLHALNRDRAGVMQTYLQLRDVLDSELGIAPSAETERLLERLTRSDDDLPANPLDNTPLIGRLGEWGRMLEAWKQASAGRSALLLLKGEAGIGKTRLALDFSEWANRQGIQTAYAGCCASVSSMSYTPVTTWLRSVPMPSLCMEAKSELSRLLPELMERFPDLPKPSPLRESWQVNRWYEAIERMLSVRDPLLLVLDDIQWSDEGTLQLISYLLRSDAGSRLLVIATMRTEEYPNDALRDFFHRLRTARKLNEIEPAPFSEEETKRLAAATAGGIPANRHALL